MRREHKVHYLFTEEGAPALASWCTPKTRRHLCTDDPREVTCKTCLRWAGYDIEDQEYQQELDDRRWYVSPFSIQRNRHLHGMLSALISIVDSLVVLFSFGWVTSSFQFNYVFWNLGRQAVKEAEQAEEQAPCENTNSP